MDTTIYLIDSFPMQGDFLTTRICKTIQNFTHLRSRAFFVVEGLQNQQLAMLQACIYINLTSSHHMTDSLFGNTLIRTKGLLFKLLSPTLGFDVFAIHGLLRILYSFTAEK